MAHSGATRSRLIGVRMRDIVFAGEFLGPTYICLNGASKSN